MSAADSVWTGWSWGCPCGWSTGRHAALEHVERSREGHLNWHRANRLARELARA